MNFIKTPSPRRTLAFVSAAFVLALAILQLLPKGTPGGVVVYGLVTGSVNALLAAGIILIYRAFRVINFAQASLGVVAAAITFRLAGLLDWPLAIAIAAGIVSSIAASVLIEMLVLRRFFKAPRLVLTVVSVVLAISLPAVFYALADRLPGLPDIREPRIAQQVAAGAVPVPLPTFSADLGGIPIRSGGVIAIALAIVALAGLGIFLRRSRLGVSIRAVAENPERAYLLGINVATVSTIVWAIAGALAGVAAIGQGLLISFREGGGASTAVLIPALAACILARMTSFPVAVAASFGLSITQQSVFWSFPRSTVTDVMLLGVILVGLLVQRKRILRSAEGLASTWQATRENRPTPKEMQTVPSVRTLRRVIPMLSLTLALVFPIASSPSQTNLGGLIAIQAIVALSLVVLTGWAGQVSLGQFAFVAISAVVGGKLTSDLGVSFWLALPLVAAGTGAFAALIGIPALRIKGIFLAVSTLALAVAVQRVLFNEQLFESLIPGRVERPSLFFIHFAEERNYYYLCLAFLLLTVLVVKKLRSSRTGRVLIAIREEEQSVQAFGINVARARISAFALSGVLAGVAGVLFIHHQRAVDPTSFAAEVSIQMFIMAMIGGITSVTGALLGATYIGLVNFLIGAPVARTLASGLGLLLLLILAPGGLAGIAYSIRDAILRIIATRRRIVVPSLFADYDPEAIARKKWALAEPIPGAGLAALPANNRYAVRSELYSRSGGEPRLALAESEAAG
ncbi:MAG TPA: ABC transporter permease [Actinomycetota bacterium]|nr:ABC transporter permease [Actinomycetota bacterium]